MKVSLRDRALALLLAVVCHGLFVLAVGSMGWQLLHGLQLGRGTASGVSAVLLDAVLVLQFPLLHSFLLGARGRPWLARLVPFCGGRFGTTTYAISASLQLLAAFWLWTPSGVVFYAPSGIPFALHCGLWALAWLFLVKALSDAGLALQTGAAGWTAVWQGRAVRYGGMPTEGLFALCRQPIYLGFASVLWTAPCWTLDWLLLTASWTVYCVLGPRLKEGRWLRIHGQRFEEYRRAVPYMFPRFRS